jgi:hypothetical protein
MQRFKNSQNKEIKTLTDKIIKRLCSAELPLIFFLVGVALCGMQGVGLGMQGVRYRAVVFKTRLLLRRAPFFILFYFFKLCGAPEREERERERENKEKERGSVCGYAWGESGGERGQ